MEIAEARPGQETLSADVFSHLLRLELLSDVSNQSFNAMGWDHKVTCYIQARQVCAEVHRSMVPADDCVSIHAITLG